MSWRRVWGEAGANDSRQGVGSAFLATKLSSGASPGMGRSSTPSIGSRLRVVELTLDPTYSPTQIHRKISEYYMQTKSASIGYLPEISRSKYLRHEIGPG